VISSLLGAAKDHLPRCRLRPDINPGVFTNPEPMSRSPQLHIQDAMEPFDQSRRNYLFSTFEQPATWAPSTKLYSATRLTDVTFEFGGRGLLASIRES